jgi:glycine oxidase
LKEKCVVIGGGIIGLFTAYELNQAGLSVTLVERGETGKEASWAGSGIVSPLQPWRECEAINQLSFWSQRHYPAIIASMEANSGISAGLISSGLLILNADDLEPAAEWARRHQVPHVGLTAQQLRRQEPGLRQVDHDVLTLPEIQQVRNPRLLNILRSTLESRGVCIKTATEVRQIMTNRTAVTGIDTSQGVIQADSIVLAAGSWSSRLLDGQQTGAEILPVRGQILMYKLRPGYLQHVVLQKDSYLVPRADGVLLAGSTVEYVGFDKSTTVAARVDLHRMAVSLLPELADAAVEKHWAGLRPGSSSGLPMIGAHPDIEGLYLNCGHFRSGLTLAPASAHLLCDIMLGRATEFDHSVFKPQPAISRELEKLSL